MVHCMPSDYSIFRCCGCKLHAKVKFVNWSCRSNSRNENNWGFSPISADISDCTELWRKVRREITFIYFSRQISS